MTAKRNPRKTTQPKSEAPKVETPKVEEPKVEETPTLTVKEGLVEAVREHAKAHLDEGWGLVVALSDEDLVKALHSTEVTERWTGKDKQEHAESLPTPRSVKSAVYKTWKVVVVPGHPEMYTPSGKKVKVEMAEAS